MSKHIFNLNEFLTEDGTDIDYGRAIRSASKDGNLAILRFLIKTGASNYTQNDYDESLLIAVENKHPDVSKFLIMCGANLRFDNDKIIISAVLQGNTEMSDFIFETDKKIYDKNETAFRRAIVHGDDDVIEFALKNYIDNFSLNQALYLAITQGNRKCIRFFTENGADINADNDRAIKIAEERDILILLAI